jgi:hypothetical protein
VPTARYGYVALMKLYVANGGPKRQAPVAAAVALAESAGKPNARHVNNNGSVDQGLWQINSSNYSGSDIYDPNVNARWAVKLSTHGRGWRNWTTFTSGKYKKYLHKQPKGETSVAGKGFGVFSQANYAGTDQGVDFKGTGPIPALGSGVVTDVGKSGIIEGGNFPYVIYRLTDGPYKGHFVYVAENFVPTVKKGTKVKTGQEVGKAVGAYPYIEVGFNKSGRGWNPVAPLNPNPHSPKPAGAQMWSYIQGVAKLHPGGGGGVLGDVTTGLTDVTKGLGNPYGTITSLFGKGASAAAGAVTDPIANALESVGRDIMYAGAILGGGITFILGFLLIAADIGLSSKAGRTTAEVAAAIPAGRAIGKAARAKTASKTATKTSKAKSNIPARSDERKEEMHRAKLKTEQARATELRTRQKNRRRTRAEQEKAEKSKYYEGARDAASPTMAKIRRDKKK